VRNDRLETIFEKEQLKKQTQFSPGRIGLMSYMEGTYDNISRRGNLENKPKFTSFFKLVLIRG
jgi:hypothetical protein